MAGSGERLIHLEGIKKVFYTDEVETHALADIHLEVKSGEYVAISGPSGCGKTTLLSILGLLDTPSEGESSRPRIESSVVLPHPEGPEIAMYSPVLISRWISASAWVSTSSV